MFSELTLRAAGFLAKKGIDNNSRVILFSNNMPEWGMTYFGILKTGATAIPIDPASSTNEVVTFAKAGEASAIVISPKLAADHPDLLEKLSDGSKERKKNTKKKSRQDAGVPKGVPVWTFDDVFELQPETEEAQTKRPVAGKDTFHYGCVADLYLRERPASQSGDALA